MTVALGFDAAISLAAHGFGSWCPKRKRRRLVACTWVGAKFPAPRAGGQSSSALASWAAWRMRACSANRTKSSAPRSRASCRKSPAHCPPAIHPCPLAARHGAVHRGPSAAPGGDASAHPAGRRPSPGGQCLRGIGIPDCIRLGRQAAARILGCELRIRPIPPMSSSWGEAARMATPIRKQTITAIMISLVLERPAPRYGLIGIAHSRTLPPNLSRHVRDHLGPEYALARHADSEAPDGSSGLSGTALGH